MLTRIVTKGTDERAKFVDRLDERGATAVEYVLMVSAIAVAVVVAAKAFGSSRSASFSSSNTALH